MNLKKWISTDLYRYYGEDYINIRKKKELLTHPEVKYMILFRKIQFGSNKFINKILKDKLKKLSHRTHIQIPVEIKIGKGFYIRTYGKDYN